MKKLLTVALLLITGTIFGQQDPLFTQYMFNKLAVNAAYAGSRELLTADILYRNQWVGIEDAPRTINASLHSPLVNPRLALGVNVYNDQLGPLSTSGALGTFAYRIIFPKGKLSFGIQAGFKKNFLDREALTMHDEDEPLMDYTVLREIVPDANFGIYYYTDKFYAGASTRQLLQTTALEVDPGTGEKQFTKLLTHFYGMTGAAIPLGDNLVFRPSVLAKFVKNAPPQLDVDACFLLYNVLWVGAAYRTEKAVSGLIELVVAQNLRIGYSHDRWLNELQPYNKGSHEIHISYDLNVHKRLLTPRYF
jgi:type IX secretion system PorP/SprF family membrane protein